MEQYNMTIIRKHIMSKTQYDNAKVPISSLLLKMDIKLNWVGKDNNITHPSLVNANDRFFPFLVMDLT